MSKKVKEINRPRKDSFLKTINWFNTLTLVLGVVAIAISWQALGISSKANDLAEQGYRSNIVILNVMNVGYDIESAGHYVNVPMLACVERMRFTNLGNVSDELTGFDTIVYYQGTTSKFYDYGEAVNQYLLEIPSNTRTKYEISQSLQGAIDRLGIKIAEDYAFGGKSSITAAVPSVSFPYEIKDHSSVDFEIGIVFGVVPGNHFNLFYEKNQPVISSEPTDLPPLEFVLEFHTASGEIVSTPKIQCGVIGK